MPFRFQKFRAITGSEHASTCLNVLLLIAIPISMVSIVMAAKFAWIFANEYGYPRDSWERCYVAPNTGRTTDNNQFAGSVAAFAGRGFVFLVMAFKAVYLGINDNDLLPYAVFVSLFALVGMVIYREASPIQPDATEMSATLATITRYIHKDMYNHTREAASSDHGRHTLPVLFPSQETCQTAYHLNVAFLVVQYLLLGVCVLLLILALGAFSQSPRKFHLVLRGNVVTLLLVGCTITGYFVALVAKEMAAQATLNALESEGLGSIFPFSKADMDIISMTMMLVCGQILIGTFHECTEKFKLAAFVGYLHIVLSCPIIVGTFGAYQDFVYPFPGRNPPVSYSMWDSEQCQDYIRIKNPKLRWPQDDLATLCKQVQVSLIGQTIIFCSMALQVFACMYVVWANRKFKRPLALTRCRTCADRREMAGSMYDIQYEPTIMVTATSGGGSRGGYSRNSSYLAGHGPNCDCTSLKCQPLIENDEEGNSDVENGATTLLSPRTNPGVTRRTNHATHGSNQRRHATVRGSGRCVGFGEQSYVDSQGQEIFEPLLDPSFAYQDSPVTSENTATGEEKNHIQ